MKKELSCLLIKSLLALFFIFYGLTPAVLAQEEGMSAQELHKRLEYLYRTAMEYENQGKYSNAIYYYQAILNLDPTQVQPPKRIAECREKVKAQTEPIYIEVKSLYARGEYIQAQEKILTLLDVDSANKTYRNLYTNLQEAADIFTVIDGDDKVSVILRKGVCYYLDKPQDIRLAYNITRYATELKPDNLKAKNFLRLLDEEYSSITQKEKPIKGMNFIEQSLFVALNNIYEGRYDLAISNCEDVLLVESDNLLALKRLGSAYYAFGNKTKAREIWERALKIKPDDKELNDFLKK